MNDNGRLSGMETNRICIHLAKQNKFCDRFTASLFGRYKISWHVMLKTTASTIIPAVVTTGEQSNWKNSFLSLC